MTPEEMAYVDTLDEQQQAVWVAIGDTWPVVANVVRAATIQGWVVGGPITAYEWDEIPLDLRRSFADAVKQPMAQIITTAGLVCTMVDRAEE